MSPGLSSTTYNTSLSIEPDQLDPGIKFQNSTPFTKIIPIYCREYALPLCGLDPPTSQSKICRHNSMKKFNSTFWLGIFSSTCTLWVSLSAPVPRKISVTAQHQQNSITSTVVGGGSRLRCGFASGVRGGCSWRDENEFIKVESAPRRLQRARLAFFHCVAWMMGVTVGKVRINGNFIFSFRFCNSKLNQLPFARWWRISFLQRRDGRRWATKYEK